MHLNRVPVVNEKPSETRRKRQISDDSWDINDDDLFNFEFDDFESKFNETTSGPAADPDFEPVRFYLIVTLLR